MTVEQFLNNLEEKGTLKPLLQAGIIPTKVLKMRETLNDFRETKSAPQTAKKNNVCRDYVYKAKKLLETEIPTQEAGTQKGHK